MGSIRPGGSRATRAAVGILLAAILLVATARPAAARASSLQDFYRHKYPSWMKTLVRRAVDADFAEASPDERAQAVIDTLAFFHVVYHTTPWHHVWKNLALAHRYEHLIKNACARFDVPPAMALSIISWENGGSLNTTSFAACVGMGQLSRGAVSIAHAYYRRVAGSLAAAGAMCRLLATISSLFFPHDPTIASVMDAASRQFYRQAARMDLARRHERMRKAAGVKDERVLPQCNIEDSVVFMRALLDAYGGRVDLAISAYHNGLGNTDDLLRDYLKRKDPPAASFTFTNRAPLLDALDRLHLSYLTLWNDPRCRRMLNGLFTMDGVPTTPANAREAMGDEADIYVWKCAGALAGFQATDAQVDTLVGRYDGSEDEAETAGFHGDGTRVLVSDGVAVRPELAGYLKSLEHRAQARGGHPVCFKLAMDGHSPEYMQGVAVAMRFSDPAIHGVLREDWLFDKVYLKRLPGGRLLVCLNPRFGDEFLADYDRLYASR